jgi:PAS domain S-box-containing protein
MTESSFRRLLLRFALVPLAVLTLLVTLLLLMLHGIAERRIAGFQATSILLQSDLVLRGLIDEETGVRGYLASGDREFLQPYNEASAHLAPEFATLSQLLGGEPGGSQRARQIAPLIQQFNSINSALVAGARSNDDRTRLLNDQKTTMNALRAALTQIISEQSGIRDKRRDEVTTLYRGLLVLGAIGGTLAALIVVLHGIWIFGQITSAFRQQLELAETQRDYLRTTLQSIGDGVIVCDAAEAVTLINPAAQKLTGWQRSQALGQSLTSVFQILNEYTREPVESPVEKVLRLGHAVGLANHTLLVNRDGTELPIDDSGAPIHDAHGNITGVVLVFRDIAEKRKAERELALRNAELESLFLHSPIGFATFDRSHRYLRVNGTFAEIDGSTIAQHIGKTIQEIGIRTTVDLKPLIDQVFLNGIVVQRNILGEATAEPGVERQWLMCLYPILVEHQPEPIEVGLIVLETTDLWRAQTSLVQSEKLAAVGRLAASIAHEMNNPLASVMNLLYLIAQDESLQGETREYVDRANIELARASKIATQTLRFAKRSMSPVRFSLTELTEAVLLLFNGRITLNRITVTTRIRGNPHFLGHVTELMQLLTNLIGNALDALPPDGSLVVSVRDATGWKHGPAGVTLVVADSGKGIPEAVRQKIWQPFFTTKDDTGTGLGLWLVDEMVKKNNGWITMRTRTQGPMTGTTFRVFLPVASD